MANQITVNSGTGNITVTTSRSVIGTVANVSTANYANFANIANTANTANVASIAQVANFIYGSGVTGNVGEAILAYNVNAATTANVIIGGGSNGYVLSTNGSGNLTWVAQAGGGNTANANYANFAGTAFSVSGSNVSGTVANATYAVSAGSANTANSATVANSANSVAGANVTGTVANATFATTAANANNATNVSVTSDFGNTSAQYVTYVGANTTGSYGMKTDLSFAYVPNTNILTTSGGFNGKLVGANTLNPNSFVEVASATGNIVANVNGTTRLTINTTGVTVNGNITANNLGNIASINLDGNASNILNGTGNWIAVPSSANANFANYAGNVTGSSQGNITSVGNLVSLQVGNSGANTATTTFTPVGANITTLSGDIFVNNKRVSYDDADVLANGQPTQDAIVTPFDTGNSAGQQYAINYLTQDLANTANIAVLGSDKFDVNGYAAGDAAGQGQRTFTIYTADSQLANANPNTTTDVVIGTSTSATALFINQKMPTTISAPTGVIGVLSYGHSSNQATATALYIQRRRGNNSGGTSTRDQVQADDYLGNIVWRGAGTTTGTVNSAPVAIGARVDSSYGGPGNVMPIGMQMTVVNSSNTQLSHNFYANGNVGFAGSITATNLGNIASINIDGNGSNVLYGNGVFAALPSVTSSITNGNSNVVVNANSNVTVSTNGTSNVMNISANAVQITGHFAGGVSNITYGDLANTYYLGNSVAQGIHFTIPAGTAAGTLTINASNVAQNGYSKSHYVYVTNNSGNTQQVTTSGDQEDLPFPLNIVNGDSLSFQIYSVNQFVACKAGT